MILGSIILALVLGFATDFLWAVWMRSVTDGRAFAAANWSAMVYLLGLWYKLQIVAYRWESITSYLVGAYFGMYLAVRLAGPSESTVERKR